MAKRWPDMRMLFSSTSDKYMRWPGLLVFLLLFTGRVFASELPLWEAGAGVGVYNAPHYLGSDQNSTWSLPLPFFVYRGDYLRSDRGGLAGSIYKRDRLDLRLSGSGSLPISSDDNRAREGMPDLQLMGEIGPSLEYRLLQGNDYLLRFDLPVRAALTFDSGVQYRGLVSNPRLYLRNRIASHWLLTATAGPMLASEKFHDYFYQVDSEYATPERPAYNAKAGFTAMRYSASISRYWGGFFVGGFVHAYDLQSAKNRDSPLVRQKDYVSTGFAISWVLRRSAETVPAKSTDY